MTAVQDSWIDKLISRRSLLLVACFSLFVLFRLQVWDWYDRNVVDSLLSNIRSHWSINILFFILSIFALITFIHLINQKRRLSNTLFLFTLFAFVVFISCRYVSDRYNWEPFWGLPFFKYADCLILPLVGGLILKVCSWIKGEVGPVFKSSPFFIDRPISNPADDKFGRKAFAKKIAEKIQSKVSIDKAGALAIGINGQWGTGKTSFANMIKEYIDRNNRIIVDFYPWRSSSSSKIIEDFFELLVKELKPYDPELSTTLTQYAKSLTKIEENILTKAAEAFSELLFDEKSKNKLYDEINDSIRKVKKQIFVFVDDLDRLDKLEIIEVLRIIRNTANFDNVVYIASYDKEYVYAAIKEFNDYNYRSFLEKIFQFEFTLPMYEHDVLRTEIKRLIKPQIPGKYHQQLDSVLDSRKHYGINFTNELVKTHRDVIRLVNSFLFEIEGVVDEIYIYDFYLLQLLKLEYPKVYESLIENRDKFFKGNIDDKFYGLKLEKDEWRDESLIVFMGTMGNNDRNVQKKEENNQPVLIKYLDEYATKYSLSEYDKAIVIHLVETLLTYKSPKKGDIDADLYKSFAYPANFHKYFSFRLYEGDVSAKDFEDYRRKSFKEYRDKVMTWLQEGKYSALLDKLDKVSDFSTVLEFENHVLILFEIGRNETTGIQNRYLLDYTTLLNVLGYPMRKIGWQNNGSELLVYPDTDSFKEFLSRLFSEAPKTPLYESHVISRLIGSKKRVALTFEELSDINFKYLKDYCDTHEEIGQVLNELHSNAIRLTGVHDDYEIRSDAHGLYLQFFKQHVTADHLGGFIRQTTIRPARFQMESESVFSIFGSWEGFENFLDTGPKIKTKKEDYVELKSFYESYKTDGRVPIEFDFKVLKPIIWQ